MNTWFVSRHPGALAWMRAHGPAFGRHVTHLEESDFQQLGSGDIVIGSLPVHLAARVCACGAQYWNLSLNMPASARGQELSADELRSMGAMLERFDVRAVADNAPFPSH